MPRIVSGLLLLLILASPVAAVQLQVSAGALERVLREQLFHGSRYYVRGTPQSACFAYVEDPRVALAGPRIVVKIKATARLGVSAAGTCVGVPVASDADVSVLPVAVQDRLEFRDARIDRWYSLGPWATLFSPFLQRQVPRTLNADVGMLLRQLLGQSRNLTGYALELKQLNIRSAGVRNGALALELDGALDVR